MEEEAKGRGLHEQGMATGLFGGCQKMGCGGTQGPVGTRAAQVQAKLPQALGWHIKARVSKTTASRVLATGWSVLPCLLGLPPTRRDGWLQAERFNSHTFNGSLCSHRPNQYPLGSLGLWLLKTFSLSVPWSPLPHLLGSGRKGRQGTGGLGQGWNVREEAEHIPPQAHPSRLARGQAPALGLAGEQQACERPEPQRSRTGVWL